MENLVAPDVDVYGRANLIYTQECIPYAPWQMICKTRIYTIVFWYYNNIYNGTMCVVSFFIKLSVCDHLFLY